MKTKYKPSPSGVFISHRTYSPEEILADGGTTIFGRKSGKDNQKLVQALSSSPKAEPFSDKEWEETLRQLQENKKK